MAPPQPLEALPDLTLAEAGEWRRVNSRNSVKARAASPGMAPGTVRGWSRGHRPRPSFELDRRKDCASVWWRSIILACEQRG